MMWVDENEVFEKLTHQTSKDAFSSIIKQFSKSIEYQMDIHLINYLYTGILPIYKSLDQAHQNDPYPSSVKNIIRNCKKY